MNGVKEQLAIHLALIMVGRLKIQGGKKADQVILV